MSQYYASHPHELRLSVSAVIWQSNPADALFLIQRSDNALWGLPGGYVELGESVQQATQREIQEETGFAIKIERLIGVYSEPERQVIAYPDGKRVQAVNLCFEAKPGSRGVATTPEEVLDSQFFATDALPEDLVPIHRVRIDDALQQASQTMIR